MRTFIEIVLQHLRERGIHTDTFRLTDVMGRDMTPDEALADWFAQQILLQGEAVTAMSAKLRAAQGTNVIPINATTTPEPDILT